MFVRSMSGLVVDMVKKIITDIGPHYVTIGEIEVIIQNDVKTRHTVSCCIT